MTQRAFCYFIEAKDTPEMQECRTKYFAARQEDLSLTFPSFAKPYLGDRFPDAGKVFRQLSAWGYKAGPRQARQDDGTAVETDLSGEFLPSMTVVVDRPISVDHLGELKRMGYCTEE